MHELGIVFHIIRTVEDVEQVPGIGPKRLEAMRPLVTVE